METLRGINSDWGDEDYIDGTPGPGVSMAAMSPELPTVTIAAIIGVTMIVLVTIAGVFLLGVLFDCRQQRLLEEKKEEVSRKRNQRRGKSTAKIEDNECIADNMEETAESTAPAHMIRNIP